MSQSLVSMRGRHALQLGEAALHFLFELVVDAAKRSIACRNEKALLAAKIIRFFSVNPGYYRAISDIDFTIKPAQVFIGANGFFNGRESC